MFDGDVAADFVVGRVSIECAPEVEILLILKSESGKEQRGLARRPAVPGLNVPGMTVGEPFIFVREIGIHERDGLANAATVRQGEQPEVVLRGGEDLAERGHVIHLEDGVAVGFGAGEFAGEAAVGRHLIRDEDVLEMLAAVGELLLIASELGERGDLQPVSDGVIVLGVRFKKSIFADAQPLNVVGEPLFHAGGDVGRESWGFFHDFNGAGDFDEMEGINDAVTATGGNAGDGLGIGQAGIHACVGIEKKDAKKLGGFGGVTVLAGDFVGGTESGDGGVQLIQALAMFVEVGRIAFAIEGHVGQAVSGFRIGPPIIAVGIKIVNAAIAVFGPVFGDGDRLQRERVTGRLQNAVAVDGADAEGWPSHNRSRKNE